MPSRHSVTVVALSILLGAALAGCSSSEESTTQMAAVGGSVVESSWEPPQYSKYVEAPQAYAAVTQDRDDFTVTIHDPGGTAPGPVTGDKGTEKFEIEGVGILGENGEIEHTLEFLPGNADCDSGHCLQPVQLNVLDAGNVHAMVGRSYENHPMRDHLDYFAFGYWTEGSGPDESFGGVFYGGSPDFSVGAGGSVGARKASYTGRAIGHYSADDAGSVTNESFRGTVTIDAAFEADATFTVEGSLTSIAFDTPNVITLPDFDLNGDGTVATATDTGYTGTWNATFYGKSSLVDEYYAPPPVVAGGISISHAADGVEMNGAYGAYLSDDDVP